ncbi:MAG TPA: VanZ family protein, partial [Steroidobacteraceae bacterium]
MLALRHRLLWLATSALLLAVVIWGSLQTSVDLPVPGGFDKVEHLGTYAFLSVWFTGMFAQGRYWLVAVALLALGLAMEIAQYLMAAGRQGDPYDMAANTLGVVAGLLVAVWVT